ncbi:hypothetical protein CR513_34045, partial [Mucuna pruriens]
MSSNINKGKPTLLLMPYLEDMSCCLCLGFEHLKELYLKDKFFKGIYELCTLGASGDFYIHEEFLFKDKSINVREVKNVLIKVIQFELEALKQNDIWAITLLPLGKTSIGCKWVYKIKFKSDGTIECYKARLVTRGFTQIEGIDYSDTYLPIAKLIIVSLLLAMAAS